MFALEPDIESFHTIHLGGTDTRATYVTRISRFRDFLEDVANSID
jgi:hypothetical protein